MTTPPPDDILDSLFHGCAWTAYLNLAIAGRCPPDSEAVRRLTYRYYEEALAERSRGRPT